MTDHAAATPSTVAPAWFEGLAVAAGLVAAAFAAPGLLLAIVGAWSPAAALGGGAALALATLPIVRAVGRQTPKADDGGPSRSSHGWAIAAIVLALLSFAGNAWQPAQHVFVDRDPGAYTTTARWLARDGSLEPDVAVGPFADVPELRYDSIAVPDAGDGKVQLQFSHGLPVLLADAHAIGGAGALFRMPALLGAAALLAIFATAHRVLGRPGLSLAATAAVAVALPQVAVSRDTFSEPLAQLWLWSGALALLIAYERRSWTIGGAGGALVGAIAMARIDGFSYLLALPILLVLAVVTAGPRHSRSLDRAAVAVAVGAVGVATVGALDLALRGADYGQANAGALGRTGVGLVVTTAIAAGLGLGWRRLPPGWFDRRRAALAGAAAVLTAAALLAAWFVRPLVQEARTSTPSGLIGLLQEAEGQAVDPLRSYAEQTMRWLAWYLGPITVALAVVGAALVVRWLVAGRRTPAGVAAWLTVLLLGAPTAALYLWSPGAAPDHIWVMRRFAPTGLVLVVVLAMHAAGAVRTPAWLGRGVAAAVGVAAVAWPAAVTWPVREHREQGAYLEVLEGTCRRIGEDAAVLLVDDDTALGEVFAGGLPMSLRAWCGVPVAIAPASLGAAAVQELAAAWAADGRTLWLVGAAPSTLGDLAGGAELVDSPLVVNDRALERTVTRRPDGYREEQLGFVLARVG